MPKKQVDTHWDVLDDMGRPHVSVNELSEQVFGGLQVAARNSRDTRIVIRDDGTIQVGELLLTAKGIQHQGTVTVESMETVGKLLQQTGERYNILIGDWLVRAELVWGAGYKEAVARLGFTYGSLRNFKSTMSRIDLSMRDDKLTYNHYYVAATKLDNEVDRRKYLQDAVRFGWSYRDMQDAIERDRPTPSKQVSRAKKLFSQQIKKYREFIAKTDRVGQDEAAEISQLIDKQIEELENLRSAVLKKM